MKTKNLTPFLFAAKATMRRPKEPEMTVVVRASFRLAPGAPMTPLEDQGCMTAERYRESDDDRAGEALTPNDFADFKPRSEAMLIGSCHVLAPEPVTECPVRFAVGAWSKVLRVVGPRAWSDDLPGAVLSAPMPFTKMPIDWAHAYGGPGFADNPCGKGITGIEAHTVEKPDDVILSKGQRHEPAGFGPIAPSWPLRRKKVGSQYGAAWRKERFPYYAEDFDFEYFQCAPADQRLEGYLTGDEEIVLQNLHPAASVVTARLPAIRIRVFVRSASVIAETRMVLDTLFAEPDEEKLTLTWRGVAKVREDDLADVEAVLVASEPLADKPLSAEHYAAILEKVGAGPITLDPLVPEALRAKVARLAEAAKRSPDEAEGSDPVSAKIAPGIAALEPEERARVMKTVADVMRSLEHLPPEGKEKVDLGAAVADATKARPIGVAPKPGSMPRLPIGDRLRRLKEQVRDVKAEAAKAGQDVPAIAELEAMFEDPRIIALDPSLDPNAPPPAEPGKGADLRKRDLSDADLAGRDLSGANLEEAILGRANLTGANLTGANLKYAVLTGAKLDGATLDRAELDHANLSEASFERASLREASLARVLVRKACFKGATIEDARFRFAFFNECDLRGVRGRGARFEKVLFRGALLEGADLTLATLIRTYVFDAKAAGLVLRGALLDKSSFAGSDLTGADLDGARGRGTLWLGATLARANLGFSVLVDNHFTEAIASDASFFGANLRGSRFYRSHLERASFAKANLFRADLGKALLTGAKFTDASLFEARFHGASGAGCDFSGANLKRSTLEWA